MTSSRKALDNALEATWKHPPALRAAAEEVTATVELAWAAVRTVFGKQARPEHAIDLARLFIAEARQHLPEPAVAQPIGIEDARPGSSGAAIASFGKAPPQLSNSKGTKPRRGNRSGKKAEVDLNTPAAPRTHKTAVVEEPPRAVSKVGRPARM